MFDERFILNWTLKTSAISGWPMFCFNEIGSSLKAYLKLVVDPNSMFYKWTLYPANSVSSIAF